MPARISRPRSHCPRDVTRRLLHTIRTVTFSSESSETELRGVFLLSSRGVTVNVGSSK